MKKLFSIMTVVALVVGMLPAINFASASYSDELQGAYDYAYGMGITTQSSIDSANIYGQLTRGAMAKMMVNYAKSMNKMTDTSKVCNFTDVANESTEFQGYITDACQMGLMGVGITAFNPKGIVTRADFGTVLSRVLWGDANNEGTPYYAAHLSALKAAGVMTNISNPSAPEVRGYVMLMMQRADESNVAGTLPAVCSTPENTLACALGLDSCPAECKEAAVVLPGKATVSLVNDVATLSVPKNAKSVKVGTIKLTAGENDTTVSSVVVARSGLGNVSDVLSLQLVRANGVAATPASNRMSTSSQTATLRFSPSLALKAGASESFDVLVSLSGAENNEHMFAVNSVNVANGTAEGTPLKLGTLKTTSYNAGEIKLNSISDSTIVAGKKDQTLTTVALYPTKDSIIKGFTITKENGEDFTKAFSNVKAYYNGDVVGNVVIDAEKITVSNLNIERLNGETANVELKGDGIYVGNNAVITGSIGADDVYAVEKASGFSMTVVRVSDYTTAFNLSNLDITLTKVTTGSITVAPGTSSVKLFDAKITSNASFDVSNYTLSITQGTGTTDFIDGKVTAYINGVDYEIATGSTTFSATADSFRVEPGTAVSIRVVGSVKSTATTGITYQVKLVLNNAKNLNNGQTVTLGTSYSLLGDTVVVGNGGYTITKPTSIPNNKTVLEGSSSDVLYFNLRANAEDQVLKSLKITSISAFSGYASKVALMQGTTELKSFTSESDLSGKVLTFDSLSTSLKKDTTVPFTVRVTLRAGEVVNLGTSVQVSMTGATVVRSTEQGTATISSSSMVAGNTYQIASNVPTVALPSQDGKNTVISFASTSNYDVEVISGSMEMTRNLVNGAYVNWSGSVKVLDSINGTAVGTAVGTAPGAIIFTFNGSGLVVDTASVDRVLELVDPANTVTADDYTVTVKNVTFRYVDRNDTAKKSAVIVESYNIAK